MMMANASPMEQYDALLQAGRKAQRDGQQQAAHSYLKEAARLNPYDEKVWLALLQVIEVDDDRLVCLHNIVQINPHNREARRELNDIKERQMRRMENAVEQQVIETKQRKGRGGLLVRAILLGLAIGASGVVFGLLLSILLYTR
jgi:hypothetical protein